MIKKTVIQLPEKLFGLEAALLMVFIKPIALLLALIMGFNLVVIGRIDEIRNINSQIENTKLAEKNYLQKVNYLKSIDQESLKNDEMLVSSSLLPEKNSYYLVNVIRKIADKYGYNVDSFSVRLGEIDKKDESGKDSKGYVYIPVSLVLVGPSTNYYNLALGLERSLPILKIATFDMKNTSGVSVIELEASGFYISEKKLIESDKLTLADLTLKQNETDLVSELNQYQVLENLDGVGGMFSGQKEFVRYDRVDPFSR